MSAPPTRLLDMRQYPSHWELCLLVSIACVQFGRGLLRKSPEWNLWRRVPWFTGMANHVASFCTHLSATCESLAINSQGSSIAMVQGSRRGFWKFKKKFKWGTNLKILQPCASARAVVGYWGKHRGTAYQPATQSLLHSLTESWQAQKGDTQWPEKSCWLCSVECICSIGSVTGTALTCSLITVSAEYSQATTPRHWGPSAVRGDNVGSKKGTACDGDAE